MQLRGDCITFAALIAVHSCKSALKLAPFFTMAGQANGREGNKMHISFNTAASMRALDENKSDACVAQQ